MGACLSDWKETLEATVWVAGGKRRSPMPGAFASHGPSPEYSRAPMAKSPHRPTAPAGRRRPLARLRHRTPLSQRCLR